MNDGGVVVHYLFNLDRGLCYFSTVAASLCIRVILGDWDPEQKNQIIQLFDWKIW